MFENKIFRYSTFLLFGGLIATYAYWIFQARTGLLPIVSDEYGYFVNTRNFVENTTLRAATTYTGKGSILFQADAHGFAYPLLHGTIGKLVGFHSLNMPFTNIAFVLLALFLVAKQQYMLHSQKAAIAIILLTYITVPMCTFSFMQESLHFLIAVGCTLLLLRIYEKRMTRDILYFLLLIGIASLFRNLWMFWSIGLIPLAKNRKDLLYYFLLFIVCAVVSFLLSKLLWDSFPSYFSSVTQLIKQGMLSEAVKSLYYHFLDNVRSYFAGEFSRPYPYFPTKLVVFCSVVTMAVFYRIKKEKIYLAASLIGVINFALLLITFDAWDWREIRSMAPLFFMFTIIIVSKRHTLTTLACLVFAVSSFPYVHGLTSKTLLEHKQQATAFRSYASLLQPPQQMMALLDTKPHPLILLGYIPLDYTLDLLLLPLRTPSGKPIRYAINYFDEQLNIREYDYFLSRTESPLAGNNLRHVMNAKFFNLYELKSKGNL